MASMDSGSHRVLNHDEVEGIQPQQLQRKKRPIYTFADLNNKEEEVLVEWLRENACIYNRKLSDNKETQKKEELWADKAEEMGRTANVLKVWYRSIRTRYVKLTKKKRLGAGADEFTERDVWIMNKFSFLAKHIGKVKKRRTAAQLYAASGSGGAGPSSADVQDSDNDQGWCMESADLPLPPSPSPKGDSKSGKARTSVSGGDDTTFTLGTTPRSEHSLVLHMQDRMLSMLHPRVTNERIAYAEWLKTVIEGFDTSIWRDFHYECSQLVYKYQLQNDQILSGHISQQSTSSPVGNTMMEGVNGH